MYVKNIFIIKKYCQLAPFGTVTKCCRDGTSHVSLYPYETLVNFIGGILWECNPRLFRFLLISQEAERLLGYPLEQWLIDPTFWPNHIHPDDREGVLTACLQAVQEQRNHVMEYRVVSPFSLFLL
jgi:PAS domain-containing protein